MTTPKPGVYKNVPFAEYVGWDAVNASSLVYMADCGAAYRHHKDSDDEDTASKVRGRYTHSVILEPDTVDEVYAVGGPVNPRTGKTYGMGTAKFTAWEVEQGKTGVSPEMKEQAEGMAEALRAHAVVGPMLTGKGLSEVSVVWECEETGLLCKARIDRTTMFEGVTALLDVKTAKDASPHGFARDSARLHYPAKACHYLAGAAAHDKRPRVFVWAAVEPEPPHKIGVYFLHSEDQPVIEHRRRRWMRELKTCLDSGVWPDYTPSVAEALHIPVWY